MAEPAKKIQIKPVTDAVGTLIAQERSFDLVFAVSSYAGSGATWVAQALADESSSIGYTPQLIKVRELLEEAKGWLESDITAPPSGVSPLEQHRYLQNLGDQLREEYGNSIGAGLAIRAIHKKRMVAPKDKKLAFIVDSLKHPDEVQALRDVYGDSFFQLSVVCRPGKRRQRLQIKFKGSKAEDVETFCSRDEAGDTEGGQHVRKTLHLADFFVANESEEKAPLAEALSRFLHLVTGTEIVRPDKDERGMSAAWGAALQSACLSRQVGAAILSGNGEVIATGSNDVPRYGGGLYDSAPGTDDHRCFIDGKYCRNDSHKHQIYSDIYKHLRDDGLLAEKVTADAVRQRIERTRVASLIEFSRSIHAEMDALISLARRGSAAAAGGTLYCTTFPCHSCARHIVAAGVREVVYVEPYPKSMAIDLHSDSIIETTQPADENSKGVHFRLFCGVAPRRFSLFEKRHEIKDKNGKLCLVQEVGPHQADTVFKKSFLDLEKDIAERVDGIEQGSAETAA